VSHWYCTEPVLDNKKKEHHINTREKKKKKNMMCGCIIIGNEYHPLIDISKRREY